MRLHTQKVGINILLYVSLVLLYIHAGRLLLLVQVIVDFQVETEQESTPIGELCAIKTGPKVQEP